jgi:hypothetical protein
VAAESGAVAVVRVWFEPMASGQAFRARITYNRDFAGPAHSVVLTEPEQVLQTLAEWLQRQQGPA